MNKRTDRHDTGFTLVEIMVALAVIAILATVAVQMYQDYTTRARVTEAFVFADAARLKVIEAQMQDGKSIQKSIALLDSSKPVHLMTGLEWRPVASAQATGSSVVGYILPTMDLPGLGIKHAFALEMYGNGLWRCVNAASEAGIDANAALADKYLPAFCHSGAAVLPPPPSGPAGCPPGTQETKAADINGVMRNVCSPLPIVLTPQLSATSQPSAPAACPGVSVKLDGKDWCAQSCGNGLVRSQLRPNECCEANRLGDPFGTGVLECLPPCPAGQQYKHPELTCEDIPKAPLAPAQKPTPQAAQTGSSQTPKIDADDKACLAKFGVELGGGVKCDNTTTFTVKEIGGNEGGCFPKPAKALCPPPQARQPSVANDPCPPKYFFVPDDPSLPWDGTPRSGACKNIPQDQTKQSVYGDRQCQACAGPDFLCEKLYAETTCTFPNNFCVNELTNHDDGTRDIIRRCGSYEDGKQFYIGTSDQDKCRQFKEDEESHVSFSCKFVCQDNNCNQDINPMINHKGSMFRPGNIGREF